MVHESCGVLTWWELRGIKICGNLEGPVLRPLMASSSKRQDERMSACEKTCVGVQGISPRVLVFRAFCDISWREVQIEWQAQRFVGLMLRFPNPRNTLACKHMLYGYTGKDV